MMKELNELCINTIRMLAVDAIEKAKSGHPGMPMGAAPMAYTLWTRFLRHNPKNPQWIDRDRFVLSAGHGSMLIYSLLHLTGYDLSLEDIKNFRQWESRTPGHPEYGHTPGVEITTGPLGQGIAAGVGMAVAERFLADRFNRPDHEIVHHYTYGIAGDGDLMEGVSHEAASLAGHLKLGKLIFLYDDNHISIEGSTDIAFTEDSCARFESYGWQVQKVDDGNDLDAIEKAIDEARRETQKPSLIAVRTHIGFGSPNKQDQASAHGEPLGEDEIKLTKKNLGWPLKKDFFVPEEALSNFRKSVDKGVEMERQWQERFIAYEKENPDLAVELMQWMSGELPAGWDREIPFFEADIKGKATRVISGTVLNAIAGQVKNLMGGSADLAPSNKTVISGETDFQAGNYQARNMRFGVREHGMGAVMNGMALHGGIIPYGGTFLIFSDYMRPAIRLAAIMGLKVIYIYTHDSIGLGEDGPTHQPIEHLAALRAMPDLLVLRPCDANETAEAWKTAMQNKGPSALLLTRQGLPILDRSVYAPATELGFGAYILKDSGDQDPDIILLASGSEVHVALETCRMLKEKGKTVRVVSMPCWELFEAQSQIYKDRVLPPQVKRRLAIEAGASQGWHRYVGLEGDVVGIDRFGASAPAKVLFEKLGLTADHVFKKAMALFS